MNQVLFTAAIAATLTLAGTAQAQYKVNEADGIAASPKTRQALQESRVAANMPTTATSKPTCLKAGSSCCQSSQQSRIAASPRLRQQLDDATRTANVPTSAVATAGYQPTGKDGITASPRLRQQLDEKPMTVIVAPVK